MSEHVYRPGTQHPVEEWSVIVGIQTDESNAEEVKIYEAIDEDLMVSLNARMREGLLLDSLFLLKRGYTVIVSIS